MNFFKLFNSYIPQKKCGIDPVTSNLIGAGAGLSGSIYTAEKQEDINEANLRNQRAENEKNRQFNHDEAELQRNWQSAEWERQFGMQSAEWYNQMRQQQLMNRQNFLFEAEYNSPENQTKRLASAGYNPSAGVAGNSGMVAAASGNMQNQGSIAVPSGGTVSGSSASFSGGQLPEMKNPFDLSVIGSFLKDLSDVYATNSKLRPEVDNLYQDLMNKYLDAQGKEFLNGINGIELSVKSITKNAQIGSAFQAWRNAITEEYLNMALKGQYDSSASLNASQKLLVEAQKKCTDEQYNQLVFAVANQQKSFDNMLKNDAAKRAADYGSARYSNSQAATEDQIRAFKVNNEQILRDINRLEWRQEYNKTNISNATVSAEQIAKIKEFTEKAAREEIITASMVVQLQDAIQRKDWYMVDQVLTHAENLINAGANLERSANTKPVKRK